MAMMHAIMVKMKVYSDDKGNEVCTVSIEK